MDKKKENNKTNDKIEAEPHLNQENTIVLISYNDMN